MVAAAMVAAEVVSGGTPALGAGPQEPVTVAFPIIVHTRSRGLPELATPLSSQHHQQGLYLANAGTISVEAPSGTFPPAPACANAITITDVTTGASNTTASMCFSEVGTEGSRLVVQTPVGISGSNRVEVGAPGLDNPAAAWGSTSSPSGHPPTAPTRSIFRCLTPARSMTCHCRGPMVHPERETSLTRSVSPPQPQAGWLKIPAR